MSKLKIKIILIFLFTINISLAQERIFEFGNKGDECNFKYIKYAPDGDYKTKNRPLVLVIGKNGESAFASFEKDSLKSIPKFLDYMFVYIPNKGSNANIKLKCVFSITSLITNSYEFGSNNLFLVTKDSMITMDDIIINDLNPWFKNIWLESSDELDLQNNTKKIEQAFARTNTNINTNDDGASYYIEPDKNDKEDNAEADIKSVKEYFGKPSAFNFTLSGIVQDKSTGESLPFANVIIKGTKNGAITNSDGYFTLFKIPTDTSTLIIQYIGYEKTEVFLTPSMKKTNLKIEISPSSKNLDEVVIVGKRQDVMLSSDDKVSLIKMTPKKLAQLPNMGEKDIMRSFQLMPGVSAANESSSGLYVRGGTPDQNLVTYDGFTVYHVDHLYGFFSAFNANALKDMQLYKGGFESKFGGRLSSVTEITGKDGNRKNFNIGGDVSLLSMNAFVEVPIGDKFSSIVTYRRSYKGFIYDKIFDKFNGNDDDKPATVNRGPGGMATQEATVTSYFYDINGKFTYRPSDKDILSLSFFNSTDKLDNSSSIGATSFGASNSDFNNSSTDLTKYGNIGGSLKWSRRWNNKLYGNTIISYSNYYSDRDRSDERIIRTSNDTATTKSGIFENNDLKDYSIKSDYEWDLFKFSKIQFGVFGTYYDIKYNYAQSDTATVLDKQNNAILTGGYIQSQTKFFNGKLVFVPGIRTTYYQYTNKLYFEPRASLTYGLTKKLKLKASTGKYYQFANRVTREDILSGSKDFWLLSDGESIPVSSATHYIAGVSYDATNYLFSVEGYHKDIQNLTEYSLRFNPSPMGVSYDENFFTGKGFSRGIEFLVQKKSGNFNGWLSYSIGEAKNQFDVYSDTYYYANQNVTHEFKSVFLYKYKRFDFSATWIYATGRPYTAPSGAYNVTLLDGSTETYFTVTDKNSLLLPNYHRLDISVNYKLLGGSKGDKRRRELGNLGFSIFNLYNRTNVWYKQFTIVDDEIIETNVNYLGITPNISLSLKLR